MMLRAFWVSILAEKRYWSWIDDQVLLKVAGQDASKQFDSFHNKAVLDNWGPKLYKGDVGSATTEIAPVTPEEPLQGLEEVCSTILAKGEAFGDGIPFGDPYWYSDWSSPYYDESHRKVRAAVRQWVEKEAMPYCHECVKLWANARGWKERAT